MKDLFSLKGRTALVTGGSRGIGRMIAAGFLAQGAKVYISSRKAAACEDTAKELSKLGPCIALPADVSTVEGAQAPGRGLCGQGSLAGHPGQQCRRGLGRVVRHLPGEGLGQGRGPEPEVAVLPHAGAARPLRKAAPSRGRPR